MGVDSGTFWSQMQNAVDFSDVGEGVVKSLAFGIACTLLAVFQGYHATPTAEGVGLATTRDRGHFLGAGADHQLHADGCFPVSGAPGEANMSNQRGLEIGTGLFVLLGFAALAFLTTQLPGSKLGVLGKARRIQRHGALRQRRRHPGGRAGRNGWCESGPGHGRELRLHGLQGRGLDDHRIAVRQDSGRHLGEYRDRRPAGCEIRGSGRRWF